MPLELNLLPPAAPALADGPIPLGVEMKNTGTASITAPQTNCPLPFRYSIYSSSGASLLQSASRTELRNSQPWLANVPRMPVGETTLAPGQSVRYEDDLASLLTSALEPGIYLIEAAYRSSEGETGVSSRVALEIAVSVPQSMAQDHTVKDGRVVIAEWHLNADGTTLLRKRETGPAPLGRFFDLLTYKTSKPVRQSAVSLNAAYGIPDYWRWLAWLDGADLMAGVAHDSRWIYPTGPIPLDLEDPALLPYGYTTAGAGAIFIVAGGAVGHPHIRLVRIPPGQDAEPVLTDVIFDKLPDALPKATCLWSPNRDPELILNWSIEISGVTLVLFGRVNALSGEMVASPKGVFTTLRPVRAFSFPPAIGPGDDLHAQLLLAPDAGGSHFTQVILDVLNPSNQTLRDLPLLDTISPGLIDRWVLPTEPYANTPVLAVAGKEIWASGGSGWTRVATGELDASSVRLWAFSPARVICTWFDKVSGYRSERLHTAANQLAPNQN